MPMICIHRPLSVRLALLALLAAAAGADPGRIPNLFAPTAAGGTNAAWRPGPGAPPVQAGADGIRFACPFRKGETRFYWDRACALDLRDARLLELELTCAQPEAIRTLGVYLRSGEGWYLWLNPLKEGGRQKLWLPVAGAAVEGRPAGRQAVNGLRISCVRGGGADAEVVIHALRLRACALAVVRARESVPNAGEANAARSAAARWSRWLTELGLPHLVVDDAQLDADALAGIQVAILPYNPAPSRRELRTLSAFAGRGGKLVVCYSAEPRLAELMGLKLGAYQAAARPGQWSSFAFNRAAPPHAPVAVFQDSGNIRPALPDTPGAKVIACWRDAAGKPLADPAWVRSDQGFWMSHVLMDGDEANKKQMLLALLGALEPAAWRHAAERAWLAAGKVASFPSLPDSVAGIRRLADHRGMEALLTRTGELDRQLRDAVARQDYAGAVDAARELQDTLVRAYALVQTPRAGEFRGVWNHSGAGLVPGDWNATCRKLADAGITAVFPNLAWAGTAHYPGRVVPASFTARTYGDQLAQSAAAARRYGLELHVWKICWNLGQAPAELKRELRLAGRLQETGGGQTLDWLCPSHPDNIAQELAQIAEIVAHAPVNGVHLDYLRYPGRQACFCPGCRRRFEAWRGRPVRNWPAGAASGELKDAFSAWRAGCINDFVRAASVLLRRRAPGVKLSAAVYPNYPECVAGVGQDWGLWLKEGWVDFVCPMDYAESAAAFNGLLRPQLALPQARGHLYPGIGVTATESRLTPDRALEQIRLLRQAGAGGFLLYELNPTLDGELLPLLPLGVGRAEFFLPSQKK